VAKNYFDKVQRNISISIIAFSAIIGFIFYDKLYTNIAFILLAVIIALFEFVWKLKWLARFYFAYLVLLIPFLIVNGILTGTGIEEEIVWYNPDEFMGLRILTIPFEDIFYGMGMLLISTGLYEFFYHKKLNA
jgi:lycopene cyclase domain-containing protein